MIIINIRNDIDLKILAVIINKTLIVAYDYDMVCCRKGTIKVQADS